MYFRTCQCDHVLIGLRYSTHYWIVSLWFMYIQHYQPNRPNNLNLIREALYYYHYIHYFR